MQREYTLNVNNDMEDKFKMSNNNWVRIKNGIEYTWDVPTLIQFAKEKKYKVIKIPLDGIDLSWNPFDSYDTNDFIKHVKRVKDTDLKYPILIDDLGTVCDGWHRIVKAIIENKTYINAIRLKEMPTASSTKML